MRGAAAAVVALFVGAGVALAAPGMVSPARPGIVPANVVAASTQTSEPTGAA